MDWDERFLRARAARIRALAATAAGDRRASRRVARWTLACGAGRHALFSRSAMDGARHRRLLGSACSGCSTWRTSVASLAGSGRGSPDIESPASASRASTTWCATSTSCTGRCSLQIRRAVRPGGLFVAAIHVQTAPNEEGPVSCSSPASCERCSRTGESCIRGGCRRRVGTPHGVAELIARRPV